MLPYGYKKRIGYCGPHDLGACPCEQESDLRKAARREARRDVDTRVAEMVGCLCCDEDLRPFWEALDDEDSGANLVPSGLVSRPL